MEAIPQVASKIVTDNFYMKVDGLTPAFNAIAQWIKDNNYRLIGAPRELIYDSPGAKDLTAEIRFPVEKV